jgi:hypothetical protein
MRNSYGVSWTETSSASFTARHEAAHAHHAEDLLDDLERFRDELANDFEVLPAGISVVIHPRPVELALAQPWLPLARLAAAPASRRYMASWFSTRELHVLAPGALEERSSGVEGSREALLLSPLHEYAHVVIGANNRSLPPPFTPRSFRRYLRWAWLCEGAATYLSGQTPYLRAAVARRLGEGSAPAFPPTPRDAPLLGGTVFDLLDSERGRRACVALSTRRPDGEPRHAMELAFGRPAAAVERDWREALTAFATRHANVYDLSARRGRQV